MEELQIQGTAAAPDFLAEITACTTAPSRMLKLGPASEEAGLGEQILACGGASSFPAKIKRTSRSSSPGTACKTRQRFRTRTVCECIYSLHCDSTSLFRSCAVAVVGCGMLMIFSAPAVQSTVRIQRQRHESKREVTVGCLDTNIHRHLVTG